MKNINIGEKIGTITILEKIKRGKQTCYKVRCECGNEKYVYKSNLLRYDYKKCYCNRKYKNGLSYSPLYQVWRAMLSRCYNKNASGYKWYGGKGIEVCKEWKNEENGYLNFYNWSIKNGYKEEKLKSGRNKYTIDRINGEEDYCPNNCRWVTYETQLTNLSKLCTNKSGYIGVSWSKRDKKWICVISIKNHSKCIGVFKTQKEAVEARNNYIDKNNLPNTKNVYIGELSYGY